MKVKNVILTGLDGQPLHMGDPAAPVQITTALALETAALAMPPNLQEPRDPKDVIARYEFSQVMHKVQLGETFDLDFDFYQKLRPDLMRVFNTLAAGQLMMQVEKS